MPERAPRDRRAGPVAALAVLALVGPAVWLALSARVGRSGGTTGDFPVFYRAAESMLAGRTLHSDAAGGYVYPPLLAFLLTPLTHLGQGGAARAFVAVNVLLALTIAVVGAREVVRRLGWRVNAAATLAVAAVGFLLSIDKVRAVTNGGQSDLLVLVGVVLGLAWHDRRPALAGASLAFSASIKYFSLIFVPYLIWRRRYAAAAWTAVFGVVFSLLPAVASGWSANLTNLSIAYGGLARLLGVSQPSGPVAANQPVTLLESVSLTSTAARAVLDAQGPIALAGVVGVLALLVLAASWWLCRRAGQPLLLRPRTHAHDQGLTAIEWIGLVVAILLFSPQTQGRHMVGLFPAHLLAAALLLIPRPGVARWPLLAATVLMQGALVLPPGGPRFDAALDAWRRVGGASWCLVVFWLTLLWTALRALRASPPPPPAPAMNA